jgi:general secretion pathway protein L
MRKEKRRITLVSSLPVFRIGVGIDVEPDEIRVVVIKRRLREQRIEEVFIVPRSDRRNGESVRDQVQEIIRRYQKPGLHVQFAVNAPASDVGVYMVELPFHDEARLRQTVPFALESLMPLRLEDVTIGYFVSGTSDKGLTQVVAGALVKNARCPAESVVYGMDREGVILDVDGCSLFSGVQPMPTEPAVLLDVETERWTLVIVNGGHIVRMRSFSSQRDHALREFQRTVRSWEYETGMVLARILISGSCASDVSVLAAIRDSIGQSVKSDLVHPFQGAVCAGEFEDDYLHVKAYGLARRAAGLERTGLDFLSVDSGDAVSRTGLSSFRTTVACLLALSFSGMAYIGGMRYRMESEYETVRRESARMFQEIMPPGTAMIDAAAQIEQHLTARERVSDYIRRFARDDAAAVDMLRILSAALPEGVKVVMERLELKEGSLQCRGKVDSYRDLDKLKDALVRSGKFSRIVMSDMQTSSDRRNVTFEMKAMPV